MSRLPEWLKADRKFKRKNKESRVRAIANPVVIKASGERRAIQAQAQA